MYETVHWINTLHEYDQIFLCFVFNSCMPESTEWSFSSCCPSKNNRADWYTTTSPTPSPRSKETLHWGTTRWERVRTAGISGGIKSAILLHSPKWNLTGEGLLLAQFIWQQSCKTFGRWQQLLQNIETTLLFLWVDALFLNYDWLDLLAACFPYPQSFMKNSSAFRSKSKEMTRACY